MSLYLKDAKYLDWQTLEINSGHLRVETGIDGQLSSIAQIPAPGELQADDRVIDCHNRLVTKSFGCGHHHIYSTLARGMPAPKKIPTNFQEILTYVWWTVDKCLDLEMVEASALASALYCAKNGVTFVIDHHASPYAVEGSLETIAKAFDRVGLSHLLCYELSDRDGEAISQAGLDEHERFLSAGGQGHIGLHASFTVGNELLSRAVDLAAKHKTGLHVHVAEDKADQDACLKDHGKRVVQRYADAGALALPQTLLVHCIHLDESEKELIRANGSWVIENIESNQNNNVGQGNYGSITDKVMLGTDGMHSDMLRSAKAAFLSGQPLEGVGMDTIYERFRNVHRYIQQSGFKGDSDNNLVILDYDAPTEVTDSNFIGHFIYGLDSRHVDTVISNGKVIVEHGLVTNVDEQEILAHACEMGNKLWKKMQES